MDPALFAAVAFLYVSLMGAIWQSHLALSRKIDRQSERIAEQGEGIAEQGQQIAEQGQQIAEQSERIGRVEQRLTRIEAYIAAGSGVARSA